MVIVDAADDLNVNAANALLKMLEEPPARATLLWCRISPRGFCQRSGRAAANCGWGGWVPITHFRQKAFYWGRLKMTELSEFLTDPVVGVVTVVLAISGILSILDYVGFLPSPVSYWLAKNRLGTTIHVLERMGLDFDRQKRKNSKSKIPEFEPTSSIKERTEALLKSHTIKETVGVGGTNTVKAAGFVDLIGASSDEKTAQMFARLLATFWRDIITDRQVVENAEFDYVLAPKEGSPILAYEFSKIMKVPLVLHDRRPKFNVEARVFAQHFDCLAKPPVGSRALIVDDSTTGGSKVREAVEDWRSLRIHCLRVLGRLRTEIKKRSRSTQEHFPKSARNYYHVKRILFTGAFSTGKTSAVNHISDSLASLGNATSIVTDLARTCPFPLNHNQSSSTTCWLIHKQIANELESTLEDVEIVLCDRGLPDILSHWLHKSGSLYGGDQAITELLPVAKRWSSLYDRIYLSRIDERLTPQADGLRVSDAQYRDELQSCLLQTLNSLKLPFQTLPYGLNERTRFVLDELSSLRWVS